MKSLCKFFTLRKPAENKLYIIQYKIEQYWGTSTSLKCEENLGISDNGIEFSLGSWFHGTFFGV
jgi:hypothetical protein